MSTKQGVRFSLGQVAATPGALEALQRNNVDAREYLRRHASGGWGMVCEEDKQANGCRARGYVSVQRVLSSELDRALDYRGRRG